MRVSVCAPELAGLRGARGCQFAAGLLPPAPLPSPAGPPSCPTRPSPAGQALGRPGGAGGGGELGSPGLDAAGGAPAEPTPLGPAAPTPLPAGPRPVKLCCCGRRGREQSSGASGREGRRAGPGRARAARGSDSGGPGPRPHHAPARRRRRRRRGRRQQRLGRRNGRRRGRPRGERRADPLPGRRGRGAGAEQRQRLGAAGPGRGQVVPGQRVGEPEQQLGLGGKEAPAADPEDPGSAPAHPPSPLCLLCRRRGARSLLGTPSRSRGTISPKVRAGRDSLRSRFPQAVPRPFAALAGSRPGARVGGARVLGPLRGPLQRRRRGGRVSPQPWSCLQ